MQRLITLKDKRSATIREAKVSDAPEFIRHRIKTCGETDFLGNYADEVTLTVADEEHIIEEIAANPPTHPSRLCPRRHHHRLCGRKSRLILPQVRPQGRLRTLGGAGLLGTRRRIQAPLSLHHERQEHGIRGPGTRVLRGKRAGLKALRTSGIQAVGHLSSGHETP